MTTFAGTAADDRLTGSAGDDIFTGGGGNDLIDGGGGTDTAVFSGAFLDYRFSAQGTFLTAQDLRAGSPDGLDSFTNVERFQFSDRVVSTVPGAVNAVGTAWNNILRVAPTGAAAVYVNYLSDRVGEGASLGATVQDIVIGARLTTSVASLAYEFFTGKVPTSGGFDYLISPTGGNANNLNSPYYQSFNVENRYINFAVNLGKLGEGRASFEAAYGALSPFEAARKAYTTIFGSSPTDAKLHEILDSRNDYFFAYGGDSLGTKAAVVGWLLAEAVKADVGVYARSNDAFLTDLADGAAYGVSIVGVYGANHPEYVYAG